MRAVTGGLKVRPYSKPVFASVSYPVIDVYN